MQSALLNLDNALIALNQIACKGEENHTNMLFAMREIQRAKKTIKDATEKREETKETPIGKEEKREDQAEQREGICAECTHPVDPQ